MSLRSNFYGKRKYILLALARAVPQRCSDSFSHSFSIIRSESYCCLPQKMVGDLQIGLFLGLSIGIGIGMLIMIIIGESRVETSRATRVDQVKND